MSVFHTRPALRWLVPTGAALAIVGGGVAVGTFNAAAEPSLPERSAAQLLVDLQTARLDGLSGTVVTRADLGLPAVAGLAGQQAAGLASLVSGTHTMRVWYAGPDQARVAVLGTLGETDVIRNGTDVWVWDSERNEAQHGKLGSSVGKPAAGPADLPATPQEAADRALAAIDPSTRISVGRSATVAGRNAYELVLDPRDPASLVGQIRIAIDAAEYVPLRFELFARGSDQPAFKLAFSRVDFERPDPAQFSFNPPPGAKVTEESVSERPPAHAEQATRPTTVGSGWATVLVTRVPRGDTAGDGPAGAGFTGLLGQLPEVSGDWGSGRLFTSKLVNGLLTDDGRVLVGAVTPERLYQVARGSR